jgi:hypothetical protein
MSEPGSEGLMARRQAAVARGVAVALPLVVREASASVLRDDGGREVIDFAGGIGCLDAPIAQLDRASDYDAVLGSTARQRCASHPRVSCVF